MSKSRIESLPAPSIKTPSITKKDLKLVEKGFLREDLYFALLLGLNAMCLNKVDTEEGSSTVLSDLPDYDMRLKYARLSAEVLGELVPVATGTQVNVGVSVNEERLIQQFFSKVGNSKDA